MEIPRPKSKQPIPDNAKKVFSGVMFDVYQWEQELFDGNKATFEKLKRPDTVIIFPVLPDGKIILTEETQPGTGLSIGTTGGRVDEGEDVLTAAKRELLEESGYSAERFILWQAEYVLNKIDWVIYVFIAKGLKKVAEQHLDAGEKITLKPVTFDEFLEIGTSERFGEKEIIAKLFEAKLNEGKMQELKRLFDPNI
jgi:ADP-ribose pyrophosphatase